MTWTYSLALTADKDKIRSLVEDTDAAQPLVQDEEINFLLNESGGSIYRAAALVCRKIAAGLIRRASLINKETGLKDDMKEKADTYIALAGVYEERGTRSGLTVFAGGISESDRAARASDPDTSQPAFRRDLHQSPADFSSLTGGQT